MPSTRSVPVNLTLGAGYRQFKKFMHSASSAFRQVGIGVRARWFAAGRAALVPRASEGSIHVSSSVARIGSVSGFGLGYFFPCRQPATAVLGIRRLLVPKRSAACAIPAFNSAAPNHSLNRTLHSLPAFGLQKPSPNPVKLFRAG